MISPWSGCCRFCLGWDEVMTDLDSDGHIRGYICEYCAKEEDEMINKGYGFIIRRTNYSIMKLELAWGWGCSISIHTPIPDRPTLQEIIYWFGPIRLRRIYRLDEDDEETFIG